MSGLIGRVQGSDCYDDDDDDECVSNIKCQKLIYVLIKSEISERQIINHFKLHYMLVIQLCCQNVLNRHHFI